MIAKILGILKIGGLIVGSIGILFGVFRFIEQSKDNTEQVKTINTTINTRFDGMDIRLNTIDNKIMDLQDKIEVQTHTTNTLQKSYIDYVRKNTQSTEELWNYLKDFIDIEKKSEDIGYYPIPLRPPTIQYTNSILSYIKLINNEQIR